MEVQRWRRQQQQHYPEDFMCPISLEVMSDPVILTSGHTFDRASIQRWLDHGNRTCPVTKLPLPPQPPLIPNHALRSLISTFAPAPPTDAPPTHSTIPAGALGVVPSITFPCDLQTLAGIRRLLKSDPSLRRLVADSGAATVLLRHVAASDLADIQEAALRIVLDVSLDGDDARVGLVADGAVDAVVSALLGAASPSCRALAAVALTSLAVTDVNKCTIGAHPMAIPGLVDLLAAGRSLRERREAATTLYALCSFPANRRQAVRCGAVPPLTELAGLGIDRAVEVLALLAKCREGRELIAEVSQFVQTVALVLRSGSARGVEHALIMLNLVCSDSASMRGQVKREGVLEMAMSLMADNGKIGKHAGDLLKMLQM